MVETVEPSKRREKNIRKRRYLRRIIAVVKDIPCADCGGEFETPIMTFDHLPEFEKSANINKFVRLKSRRQLFIEMAKCDVVCRPCHDVREIKRINEREIQ